ncbi:MAG: hypothetical protein JSW22_02405 [Chloroflexota bacterium]|nr:MAG: hypothetical protein JSW22_02405 [Chloroflexota bacterium]
MNKRMPLVVTVSVLLLLASSCTAPTNREPIITSLYADPVRVIPFASCQVACNASDIDGDELSYNWSMSGGELGGDGAVITWTAPHSEGSHNITVVVTDGQGGAVSDWVLIMVRANNAPVINDLVASAEWTFPLGSLDVTCDALDPDGDELSYVWSTNGGTITGAGCEAVWTAPEQVGEYAITVMARDTYDGSDTMALATVVALEEPLIIEDLLVTAEHCYLKAYSWGYKVGKGQEYYIECIVADTSVELIYDWFCENGQLTGGGSIAIWTAPNTSELITVSVTVSDVDERTTSEYVVLGVVSCSACTFPCE